MSIDTIDFAHCSRDLTYGQLGANGKNILNEQQEEEKYHCSVDLGACPMCPYCNRVYSDSNELIDHLILTRRAKHLWILKNPDMDPPPIVKRDDNDVFHKLGLFLLKLIEIM